MYWRRSKPVYVTNECLIDINEVFNGSFGRCPIVFYFSFHFFLSDGVVINSYVTGEVICNAKLSGDPDLTLNFENPGVMEDVSLHHCVRYFRWMHQKTVSFVPPDGVFQLMKYRSGFAFLHFSYSFHFFFY